jgi:cell division transport system permease protein
MQNNVSNLEKRKLQSSVVSSVVSISLVLFMLGLLGLVVLYAQTLSNFVKENIGFSVIMKENTKEADIIQFQKTLDTKDFVKYTEYITREAAAKRLEQELGENFVDFLGFNPLLPSIDIKLKAEYANSDSLVFIERELRNNPQISEVFYQKDLVTLVNQNLKKIGGVILIFCGLLSIVALALINNTIRLSIYSKRFLIKTMQLVGATQSFIRRPFVVEGITQGIVAALIANLLIGFMMYLISKGSPEMFALQDIEISILLFILVFLLGIIITAISTTFAVGRYLKLKRDELYY